MRTLLLVSPLLIAAAFVSGCSEDKSVAPDSDTVPPSAVQDLGAESTSVDETVLTWTAPGDDGREGTAADYEIRYSRVTLDNTNWDQATRLWLPPAPSASGTAELMRVVGLDLDERVFFAIRSADETPNWSPLSNIASLGGPPPSSIVDFSTTASSLSTISLQWTAPSVAEGAESASEYELRISSIDPGSDWDGAEVRPGLSSPSTPGLFDSFVVTELEQGTTYYLAIRSAGSGGAWSEFSNTVQSTTVPFSSFEVTTRGGGLGANSADWGPNNKIVCRGNWDGGQEQAQVQDVPGRTPAQLTTVEFGIENPKFSPDGQQVSYLHLDRSADIWIVDVDGSSAPTVLLSHDGAEIMSHAWSPDGLQMAYIARTGTVTTEHTMYVAPVSGGAPTPILSGFGSSEIGGGIQNPSWSPDGTELVFAAMMDDWDIWKISVQGGTPTPLFTDDSDAVQADWSPDGTQFAVTTNRGTGTFNIWVVSESGDDWVQVSSGSMLAAHPTWSPDGNAVAYSLFTEGSSATVWAHYFR